MKEIKSCWNCKDGRNPYWNSEKCYTCWNKDGRPNWEAKEEGEHNG